MDMQARTGDIMLTKSREMTGMSGGWGEEG